MQDIGEQPDEFGDLVAGVRPRESLGDAMELALAAPALPAHFYFHVPFCRTKCSYCDFTSLANAPASTVFTVFSGMEAEVHSWAHACLPGAVSTVYVGGGTPSLHAPQVASLLDCVREELPLCVDAEVTVEANPDSLSDLALKALADAGTTRVSVGVQAFDDHVLGLLGRRHDARQAFEACRRVSDAGLELSVDLICGVPGQTAASWETSLERAIEAGARHVSVYPLTIEEGTPLAVAVGGGLVEEPDPDVAEAMMRRASEVLAESGIIRYEVANYAVPGHEARHNSAYWLGGQYVGVGPAAHGMLDVATARVMGYVPQEDADVARVRYAETSDIDGWIASGGAEVELLNAAEAAREDVMLGLRLVRGVPVAQVEAAGLEAVLESLARDGLVERVDSASAQRWRTTERGWLLGNEVFGRVWAGE